MSEIIAEYVDRLCTVEMRPGAGNLPRGVIHGLYAAARGEDAPPLTLRMAQGLLERVARDDKVFILTGAGGPPVLPCGEVDGLLGAAALARALHFGRGADVYVLTEDRSGAAVRAACAGAGLNFVRDGEPAMDHAVTFVAMPLDDEACRTQADELLDRLEPAAVIAVEKLSPNALGVIHGATGLDYTEVHAKPQYLFDAAAARGILTAGVGDGGNEVGFGVIADEVRDLMPAGRLCLCPCGGGSTARVGTDHFMVAAISNWGAYGVAAVIAHLLRRRELLIDADDLERMLRGVIDAGAFDGATARPSLSDDGVPIAIQRGFMTMLGGIVEIGLTEVISPGH